MHMAEKRGLCILMYKQTVVPFNKAKYSKASRELLDQVFCAEFKYVTSDGKQWVCKTCDGALSGVSCQFKLRLTSCN